MAELWERQTDPNTGKDEPDCAFQGFTIYRDMQARQRSLPAVHAALKAIGPARSNARPDKTPTEPGQPKKRIRFPTVEEWSARWNWILRARAWDNELDRRRRQAQIEEQELVGKRHAQLADAYLRGMQQPLIAVLQRLQTDPAILAKMDFGELLKHTAAMARATPRMMQIERLARGMPLTTDPAAKAGEGQSADSLPIEGMEITWGEKNCIVCAHPHSRHDQMHEDPLLVPCTVEGCKCRKFKKE